MIPSSITAKLSALTSQVTSKLSNLDTYLSQLENKIDAKLQVTNSFSQSKAISAERDFENILDGFQDNAGKPVQALPKDSQLSENLFALDLQKSQVDDLSKLPNGFEEFMARVVNEEGNSELNLNLLKSVIKQESGFNPQAKNKRSNAAGLMQLMPATAKEMGVEEANIYNPYQNLRAGTKYLASLLDRYNNHIPKALAAYNAGPSAVDKYSNVPPYRETQEYVNNIMADYREREGYKPIDKII